MNINIDCISWVLIVYQVFCGIPVHEIKCHQCHPKFG